MVDRTLEYGLGCNPVDIYVRPPLLDVEILDFHKADSIYEQGLKAKDGFKRQLERLLGGKSKRGWFRRD